MPTTKPKSIGLIEYSRYAQRLVHANPTLLEWLDRPSIVLDRTVMADFLDLDSIRDESELRQKLRLLRQIVMLQLAADDLADNLSLEAVFSIMTLFADRVVLATLDWLTARLVERHGQPVDDDGRPQSLIVIAMGKLGSGELNVSSDIDLIFAYGDDGETTGLRKIGNDEFFLKLAKKLIHTLAEATGDGFVFRVDMRLRPNGESGPLVCSLAALENYFVAQGRDWERYAWLRARAITTPHKDELFELVTPFVFRRYLDFGTIDAMREIHKEIRRKILRKDMRDNIKHGPGGIREVEFVVQAFQLIHGGKQAALRSKSILETLKLLGEIALIAPDTCESLSAAYRFLRRLEHRLMYLDDAQTQDLPQHSGDQTLLARAMGFGDYEALLSAFAVHRRNIAKEFDRLFIESPDDESETDNLESLWQDRIDRDAARDLLTRLCYDEPDSTIDQLTLLRQSVRYRRLNMSNRRRFDAIVVRLIGLASRCAAPDIVLGRTLNLLESIVRHGAYLALLKEHRTALDKVVQIAESSRWANDYLIKHPILLDEMLDPRLLYEIPQVEKFREALTCELDRLVASDGRPDMERQMDRMREMHHALVFHLLSQDLARLLPLETLSDHLSLAADIVLEETVKRCWSFIRARHPHARPEPAFAIIGYGKLGGKELGYASDLDLVFLFDDDGPDATDLYSKMVQRIQSWLSTTTVAGKLFDVDTQLRPNGAAGLLVHSRTAFERYQYENAWVWEHQALTRARFVCGDDSLGQWFESLRMEILQQKRDLSRLKNEVVEMRRRMSESHRPQPGYFDVKHDRGGIVDVEFIVQYLVLAYSGRHPELTRNLGNIALLRMSAEFGLIGDELAETARSTYREYRRAQHALRLNGVTSSIVEADRFALGRQTVLDLWESLFGNRL